MSEIEDDAQLAASEGQQIRERKRSISHDQPESQQASTGPNSKAFAEASQHSLSLERKLVIDYRLYTISMTLQLI